MLNANKMFKYDKFLPCKLEKHLTGEQAQMAQEKKVSAMKLATFTMASGDQAMAVGSWRFK